MNGYVIAAWLSVFSVFWLSVPLALWYEAKRISKTDPTEVT